MTLHQHVLGVDAARDWIDVCGPDNRVVRIATDPAALKAFARGLPAGAFLVFEASGGCERPLMDALEAHGIAHARVNPRQAREFARATGRLAKTDKVDARVLAEMGAKLDLRPAPPPDPARRRLAELVARREDLVASIAAESQRLGQAREAFVKADIRGVLAVLRRRKLAIEAEIDRHKRQHASLDELDRRLRSAPGVGPAIASILLARLPELGAVDRRAIASLAGIAPHARDSGHARGRRCIWGGRADVRRALYLAAFIASRSNPELRAMRTRLQAAGKPFKVAIIALARKLLTILNAMIAQGRDYKPSST
jgi:transposase